MKLDYKQRAYAYAAAVVCVLAVTTWWVIGGNLNPIAYVFVAFGCYPMAKYVWQVFRKESRNTIKRLTKALPKCGFTIEQTDWSDDKTNVCFTGKFKDDMFQVMASTKHCYVDIVDLPWLQINVSDPNAPRLMETVNTINCQRVGPRVVLTAPDQDGNRALITAYCTILPDSDVHTFLGASLIEMLNRKPAFHEDMQREKPWLAKPRGPIGFAAQDQG